ncbi:MAG: hypothetical protein KDA45_05025, partial [Planctomycetales bacterium]|nr:hypothetical protein [Planctomycetales bacterium]
MPAQEIAGPQIPGTKPLTLQGDIAAQMVDGIDRFLLSELEASIARRASFWKRDFSSAERYQSSLEPNRQRLAHILGVRDARIPFEGLELVSSTAQSHVVGQGQGYQVFAVRWPVVRNIHGEGLLLVPDQAPVADVIAVPDADQTPEMLSGLSAGLEPQEQFARLLVENGCRVLVPQLINREIKPRGGRGRMTNREYLYRSSFEL